MVYKKSILTFWVLSIILSQYSFSDERAPKGKCYLGIGFVNSKSQVEDFAKKSGYNPVNFEIFERQDKKLYFTLGKIDEKLYKRNKSDGYFDEKFFCASGKGYLRRFNLTSEYKLIKGSKRFLDYQVDLQAALKPYANSTEITKQKNKEILAKEEPKKDIQSSTLTSNNLEIDFGSSSSGIILNNQSEALTSFKIYLDNKIQSTKNLANLTRFRNKDYSYKYASFSFGVFRNIKYEGYLTDLSGNLVLNPNAKPEIIALQIPDKAALSGNPKYQTGDSSEAKTFIDSLVEFNYYTTLLDYSFEWGQKELQSLYPSTYPKSAKFDFDPFVSVWDPDSKKYDDRSQNCLEYLNLEKVLYLFAPISCMRYFNKATGKMTNWSWRDKGSFELIKEINALTLWTDPMEKEINNLKRMAKEFKINPKNSFVTFNISDSKSKLCFASQGNDNLNNLIKLHVDKSIEKTQSVKVFDDLNSLYLEISQIKEEGCGNLVMTLESFAMLSGPMNDLKYSLANIEAINKFFTNEDLQESFINLYSGLTTKEVESLESITSMEITPKNAIYFKELENQFNNNGILFSKNNFDIYKKTTNQIYGNTYLSNIISILKYSAEIYKKNIDLNSPAFLSSINSNFTKMIDLKNIDKLKIYHNLITSLNLSLSEIDQLFTSLKLIQKNELSSGNTFDELFSYYISLIVSTKDIENTSTIDVKTLVNNNKAPDGLKINEYINKLANLKKAEEVLAAKKAKEAAEKAKAIAKEAADKARAADEIKAKEGGYASVEEYKNAVNEVEKQKKFDKDVQLAIKAGRMAAKRQFSEQVYRAACKKDIDVCSNNADVVNINYGGFFIPPGCKRLAESNAKYGDIDWGGWLDLNFGSFRTGTSFHDYGTITFIDNVGKYQNGFGAMVKTTTYCEVDMKGGRGALNVWVD